MSNEYVSFCKSFSFSISLKFLPITNSWLKICMAANTAFLIGISPDFEIRLVTKLFGSFDHSGGVVTTFPARSRPQVDAFTKRLSAWFKWSIHSPSDNFSEIIRSRVFLSGILNTDSARHIRATPSLLSRPYSFKKASSLVRPLLFCLQSSIIFLASSEIDGSSKNLDVSVRPDKISASDINLFFAFNIANILIFKYQVATLWF